MSELGDLEKISQPKDIEELTQLMQVLLKNMEDKVQQTSDQILNRLDEMNNRVDDLEKNIADLMTQAGASPASGYDPPGIVGIGNDHPR